MANENENKNESAADASTGSEEAGRATRVSVVGVVVSDKMQKTIVVREERLIKHPRYGKYVRRYTKYKAHDEAGEAHVGDKVEIMQTRPLSKSKCWRFLRVIERAPGELAQA